MGTKTPLIIGISGGSGSGKTSVTNAISEVFKDHSSSCHSNKITTIKIKVI